MSHGVECQRTGGGAVDQDPGDQRETRETEHPLTGRDSGNASNDYTAEALHDFSKFTKNYCFRCMLEIVAKYINFLTYRAESSREGNST